MKKSTVLISIFFNESKYIQEMLNSISKVRFCGCFLYDNGSKDATNNILKKYKNNNFNKHIYKKNINPFNIYRKAIQSINADYFYCIGGDDFISCPKKLDDYLDNHIEHLKYNFPKIEYFSDKTREVTDYYPHPEWVKECNECHNHFDIVKTQLKYASLDVHVLGLHETSCVEKFIKMLKPESLEGYGFWITLGSLLSCKPPNIVNISDEILVKKRIENIHQTGISHSETFHKRGFCNKMFQKILSLVGSVWNTVLFYKLFKLDLKSVIYLLLYPRYKQINGENKICFYGPILYVFRGLLK